MLQWKHSAILLTFIKLPFVTKICVLYIFEWLLKTGFTVLILYYIHYRVDKITIPSKLGKGVLHRVSEVFDCWFESGSMPYAQVHYPFEHKKDFDDNFPADFIAEGIDQTRGWYVWI